MQAFLSVFRENVHLNAPKTLNICQKEKDGDMQSSSWHSVNFFASLNVPLNQWVDLYVSDEMCCFNFKD